MQRDKVWAEEVHRCGRPSYEGDAFTEAVRRHCLLFGWKVMKSTLGRAEEQGRQRAPYFGFGNPLCCLPTAGVTSEVSSFPQKDLLELMARNGSHPTRGQGTEHARVGTGENGLLPARVRLL